MMHQQTLELMLKVLGMSTPTYQGACTTWHRRTGEIRGGEEQTLTGTRAEEERAGGDGHPDILEENE